MAKKTNETVFDEKIQSDGWYLSVKEGVYAIPPSVQNVFSSCAFAGRVSLGAWEDNRIWIMFRQEGFIRGTYKTQSIDIGLGNEPDFAFKKLCIISVLQDYAP